MKSIKPQNQKPNTQFNAHKRKPENKDDLDSREGEEQLFKKDDITHNKKEGKNDKKIGRKNKLFVAFSLRRKASDNFVSFIMCNQIPIAILIGNYCKTNHRTLLFCCGLWTKSNKVLVS